MAKLRITLSDGKEKTLVAKGPNQNLKNIIMVTVIWPVLENEYLAYTHFASDFEQYQPKCFFVAHRWWTRQFLLVMEDLSSLKGGNFAIDDLQACEAIIEATASIRRSTLSFEKKMSSAMVERLWPPIHAHPFFFLLPGFWSKVKQRKVAYPERYADRLLAHQETVQLFDLTMSSHDAVLKIAHLMYRNPRWPGFCHADGRLDNFFFGGERKILVDFQTLHPCAPGRDLGWTLMAELSPQARRQHQKKLVALYAKVVGDGVPFEDYYQNYR